MNIIRIYNRNRKKIWIIVIIIASLILCLQIINKAVEKAQKQKLENEARNNIGITVDNNEQIQINESKSVVTGKKISEKGKTEIQVIKNFLENCNNGKIEDAYSMLTDECKEQLYPSINEFKIYYCGNFFKEPRASFEVANWVGNTYKVDIVTDILAIGKKADDQQKQDYITAIKTDNDYKLNVNSYVKRIKINRETQQNEINIKVNYKDIYMNYERYNMTIKNNNVNNIFLDTKNNVNSMYIEDKEGIKYPAVTNEIDKNDLKFIAGEEKTLSIKYYSSYISTKTIYRLNFSNVILDSDKYTSMENENQVKIIVNI